MRLSRAKTCEQANAVLDLVLPEHLLRFAVCARVTADCHRECGRGFDLAVILSVQAEWVVSNDFEVLWANRYFQLLPPAWPGLRGGRVLVERRRDGAVMVRFGGRYLSFREVTAGGEGKTAGEGREGATVERSPPRSQAGSGPYKPAANHPWRKRAIG